jgi:transposase
MLGDKAHDSAELRGVLEERGAKPIIPNRCNRKQPFSFGKRLYKLRWRIESAFNRLKDFRRIATRYGRLARNYLSSVSPSCEPHVLDLISLSPNMQLQVYPIAFGAQS